MKLLLSVEETCTNCGVTQLVEIKKDLDAKEQHMDQWEHDVRSLASLATLDLGWEYVGLCPKCSKEYKHRNRSDNNMVWNGLCWERKNNN